jgi:hypothetical protein
MAKANKEYYILTNILSGTISGKDLMSGEEAETRNKWLETFGSKNIKWLNQTEMDRLVVELARDR